MLPDIDRVTAIVAETAAAEIVPHFQKLRDEDVRAKRSGELVTAADLAAETVLARRLGDLLPGSTVVGEEAVEADASVLDLLDGDEPVWVVDPIDGTGNFAAGRPTFAVMVALVRAGRTLAGWIHDPLAARTAVGEVGGGAVMSGRRLRVGRPAAPSEMRGTLHASSFAPPELARRVQSARGRVGAVKSLRCAGHEYIRLATGETQFSLFTRLMPWDHAPGSLIVREAGGVARCLDGSDYGPRRHAETGLLMAPDAASWHALRQVLLGPD